ERDILSTTRCRASNLKLFNYDFWLSSQPPRGLHLKVECWKMRIAKQETRNDEDSECLPVGDHSEIKYLWHRDVPKPPEDPYQNKKEDNRNRDEQEEFVHNV
ncbi:MAG: hypothetical protein V4689_07685, partial [Verrucomicrobiota bacterium]